MLFWLQSRMASRLADFRAPTPTHPPTTSPKNNYSNNRDMYSTRVIILRSKISLGKGVWRKSRTTQRQSRICSLLLPRNSPVLLGSRVPFLLPFPTTSVPTPLTGLQLAEAFLPSRPFHSNAAFVFGMPEMMYSACYVMCRWTKTNCLLEWWIPERFPEDLTSHLPLQILADRWAEDEAPL